MEGIETGKSIELAVIGKRKVNSRQCYIVETPDHRRQAISLLRFQFDEEIPKTLRCIVKDINSISGELTLEQDFGPILRRFYETGKEYPFIVISEYPSSKKKKTFSLADGYGFRFNLQESVDTKLYAHQHVKCIVREFKGNKLKLSLSDSSREQSDKSNDLQQRISETISEYSLCQHWDRNKFVELIFSSQEKIVFYEQCTIWLQSELLGSEDTMRDTLDEIHEVCLYLLEGCDILKNEKQAEREGLQERISKLLDLTERFVQAVEIVEKDECDDYIDSLLSKLSTSGYIYHPNHRLGILITIFALNPELMEERMDDLLDVIHKSTLDYWKQEPFRTAFIRLLDMYIKSRRKNADLLSVSAGSNVRSIVKALSVQLLLVNSMEEVCPEKLPCDVQLNRSMLYRYASYFMTRSPKTLLERSFRSLMEEGDSAMYYNWEDTKNVELLANKLSAFMDNDSSEEESSLLQHEYYGQKARLSIGNSGVLIHPITTQECFSVLPKELNLWHQLQVMLPDALSKKTRVNLETLRPYKQMWSEIEKSIFEEKPKKVKKEIRKTLPEQGDIVHIRVISINGDTLHCSIEEEDVKGEGTMSISDIVDWNPRVYDECFIDEGGYPLLMLAKVVSVNPSGQCTFNMKRLIRQWVHDEISYGETVIMRVKSIVGNTANGFSSEGFPMTAVIPEKFDAPVNPGEFLEAIMDSDDDMRHSNITVSAVKHKVASWDDTLAFMNLINIYADDVLDDGAGDVIEDVIPEGAELQPSYVKELILLFDRQAAVEPTIRSFNYLGVARLLSLVINDKELSEYYKWRMALLEMLQDFSINEKIDETKFEELQKAAPDIFAPGSQLRLRFMQIMAISCQGHPERNHELWKMICEETDENLKELASMVLSWNFTVDKDMEKSQEEINARIYNLLSLKQRKSTKKNYGKESRVVEFKTSMVYPPENHYRANIKAQTAAIMKEIAAFLNTDGGTLYLGVNNEGSAEGLENDLAFSLFCYSPDKYDIYFHNQVKALLGLEANSLISCEWEEADDKQVYVVSVKPCPHVVLLNGTVYERHDTSSEPLTGAYREEFLKKRPLLVAQMMEQKAQEQDQKDVKPKVVQAKSTDNIATSSWRSNVLFSWDPDYTEPEGYICFQPGDKFCLLSADQPPYNQDDFDLALTIAEEEVNGYLIMAFENGKVCKVAMKEILEKNYFTSYKRVSEKMIFACPANENDYLFSVLRDYNGFLYYRTDKIESLQRTKITDSGELLNTYIRYDIVHVDIIPSGLSHYCKEAPGKSLGINAVIGSGPKFREDLMRELGIKIPN